MLIGRLYNEISGQDSEAYEIKQSAAQQYKITEFGNNLTNFNKTWKTAREYLKINKNSLKLTTLPEMAIDTDRKDMNNINQMYVEKRN